MAAKKAGRPRKVTDETIKRVKDLRNNAPTLTNIEMANILGDISSTTVGKILNGYYDKSANESNKDEVVALLWEILDVQTKNNALLAEIATMLVNKVESLSHVPNKKSESHFRNRILENRVDKKGEEDADQGRDDNGDTRPL